MLTRPRGAECPLGQEAESELQESGRLEGWMGLRQLWDWSLKEAWLHPVATAGWRCHRNGHPAHPGCRDGPEPERLEGGTGDSSQALQLCHRGSGQTDGQLAGIHGKESGPRQSQGRGTSE